MNNILQIINWEIKNNSLLFYFKFLLIIGLFIFFSRYLNQTSLLSLILILIIVYYLLSFTNSNYQDSINQEHKEESIINLKKYQFIQRHPNLLNVINNISVVMKFNRTTFNNILIKLDNFLFIHSIYSKNKESPEDINILNLFERKKLSFISNDFYQDNRLSLVDNAILFYESILNDLMSIYISIPLYNEVVDKKIETVYKSYFYQLKDILDIFIVEIKKINNSKNLNCYSKIYNITYSDIEDPQPNITNQYDFSPHWNIY